VGVLEKDEPTLARSCVGRTKSMRTVEEFRAMPRDPVSELSNLMRWQGRLMDLAAISALYRAEQRGYTVPPLIGGYPLSCIGNMA
jgi:hypothetical protein